MTTTKKAAGRTTVKKAAPEVTSASAWRKPVVDGVLLTLPSGNVARVRRSMDLLDLLKNGHIPNPLAAAVQDMIQQGKAMPDTDKMTGEATMQMMDLIDKTVSQVMIEPKCQLHPADWAGPEPWIPDEDAVAITDVELDDRIFIFAFAQGFAGDLEKFRQVQESNMAPVSDVEGVSDKAESTTED